MSFRISTFIKNLWFPNYIPNPDLGCSVLGWKVISLDLLSNQIMLRQEETFKVRQVPKAFFGHKLLKAKEYVEYLESLGFSPQLIGSKIVVARSGN